MDKEDIYQLTDIFHMSQWREFTRMHLDLDDTMMKEFETNYRDDFKELKYQTIIKWTKKNPDANFEQLHLIKQKFYMGRVNPSNITGMPQGDADGIQRRNANCYPLKNKKGVVLVIGNTFARTSLDRTEACKKDLENMKKLWKDTLKCELLEVHCDKTAEEMRTLLRQVGEEKDCDYAVVVISTHGGMVAVEEHTSVKTDKQDQNETPKSEESVNTEKKNKSNPKKYEEVLFGNDRSKLKAEEIQEIFRNENTKNLQDKPKLFILQYCRGSILDCGVDRDDFSDYPDTGVFYHIENQEYLGQDLQETTKVDTLMPSMCDVVTAYPTHLNHQAFNSKSSGSWIIRYISEVFGKYYKTKHVTDMLTIVNNKMKNHRGVNEHGKNCKAMSIYESSLTKDFYLV